ncbi:zinc transporter foi isoform X2 [Chironomus tepperi]|uniref:zinc transporter foi isoform X2 n=1 Tax=Chironomus tepperi TaxID=113505 RepID=UPI00391F2B63
MAMSFWQVTWTIMAHRHLMAVCVVCLLCAEHLPCKEHVLSNSNINNIDSIDWKNGNNDLSKSNYNYQINSIIDVAAGNYYDENIDKYKKEKRDEILSRKKRHGDHSHSVPTQQRLEMPEVTKVHLEKTIRQFSNNQTTMNVHAFEDMITQLKLNYLFNLTLHNSDHKTCMTEETFLMKLTHFKEDNTDHSHEGRSHEKHDHMHGETDDDEHDDHGLKHDDHDHHHHHDIELSSENMMSICPILLYYIINRDTTLSQNSCFDPSHFNTEDTTVTKLIEMEDRKLVWLYSTLSVLIVSACGLCGVIVVPIMDKQYYHLILQFLVALAVGTMTGDTLLHLLPHAMLPLTPDQDLHRSMMHRGLIIFACIVFSYFFERFIATIMEYRQKKEKKDKNPKKHIRVVRESESTSVNPTTCKHKYSSYPYCYDEINLEAKEHNHDHDEKEEMLSPKDKDIIILHNDTKKVNGLIHENSNDIDNTTLSTSLDGSIESSALFNNVKQSGNPVSNSASFNAKIEEHDDEKLTTTIILREHQSKHHGHSHTHGHVHSPPESLSAVAWMVILGDGLHNFTDGMAIGAAFSGSIAGGFSTSLAVLCHELPHELGDFAVLLKAGMSPKKAICYNILTGVLCVFGMIAGVLVGDTPEASQYIFAGTAGLFIYIALVDMMPELTSSHGKEGNCMLVQCSLQFSGMLIGLLCMLFIAIYEDELMEVFN